MRGGSNLKGYMTFFRPQVYERIGISLFKVYMKGMMSFRSVKKAQKSYQMHFSAAKRSRKRSGVHGIFMF